MKIIPILTLALGLSLASCSDDTEFAGDGAKDAAKTNTDDGSKDPGSTAPEISTPGPAKPGTSDGTKDPSSTTPEPTTPGTTTPEKNSCDLTEDIVKIKFPTNIQTCMDSGNVFDFYTQACSPIKKASSYDCSFDGVKDALKNLGISTAAVEDAISKNAKLVACGEKREGLSIITQWWYPTEKNINEKDCTFNSQSVITTGCFQVNNGDGTVTEASTPEERSAIIKECLK